jgi:hypothetical protein
MWCGGNQPIFLDEIVAGGERGSGRYKQVIPKHLQLLQRLPLSDEIFYELNTTLAFLRGRRKSTDFGVELDSNISAYTTLLPK